MTLPQRSGQPNAAIGNEFLRFFGAGNHSFTGIVNHTRQDLRPGKNPAATWMPAGVNRMNHLKLFFHAIHQGTDIGIRY
jgi:hypothetical protein